MRKFFIFCFFSINVLSFSNQALVPALIQTTETDIQASSISNVQNDTSFDLSIFRSALSNLVHAVCPCSARSDATPEVDIQQPENFSESEDDSELFVELGTDDTDEDDSDSYGSLQQDEELSLMDIYPAVESDLNVINISIRPLADAKPELNREKVELNQKIKECEICLEDVDINQFFPCCENGHYLHLECYKLFLESEQECHKVCPFCRDELYR